MLKCICWYRITNTQIPNLMKIRPVGAELFHADGRTDTTEITVAFRNFTKARKKGKVALCMP